MQSQPKQNIDIIAKESKEIIKTELYNFFQMAKSTKIPLIATKIYVPKLLLQEILLNFNIS